MKHLFKYLRNNTENDMSVNGFRSHVVFGIWCPTGMVYDIYRCNLVIMDAAVKPEEFGGLPRLDNGVLVQHIGSDGKLILDFTDDEPIRANVEFGLLAGVDVASYQGSGDNTVQVRWTISRAGMPLRLTEGQSFLFTIRDDLRELDSFRAMCQGVEMKEEDASAPMPVPSGKCLTTIHINTCKHAKD